jgi:cellulase/cellobiase CelA1
MCCDDVYKVLRMSRAPNPFARPLATSHTFRGHLQTLQGSMEHGRLHHLLNTPTAFWIDCKASLVPLRRTLADLSKQDPPPTLVAVVYNLPNRDCNARASSGEICCAPRPADGSCDMAAAGSCRAGLKEYRDEFIAPLAALLSEHVSVPGVLILEPDSLPNLVTNTANPRCGSNATRSAYEVGISLALRALREASPRVTAYLDAGQCATARAHSNRPRRGAAAPRAGAPARRSARSACPPPA